MLERNTMAKEVFSIPFDIEISMCASRGFFDTGREVALRIARNSWLGREECYRGATYSTHTMHF